MVHWRREWQTTSVFLSWEPHEQYEKANRTLKDELPRSVGAQYTTGGQWRNNSRKNEEMEPKQKQALGVGDGQEDLVCYSPWDHKESDTTEWLNWTITFDCWLLLQCVILSHQESFPLPVASTAEVQFPPWYSALRSVCTMSSWTQLQRLFR